MIRVLIISAEPRLVSVIKEFVGEADYSVVDRWSLGQSTLFQDNHHLALIDYECLKAEQIDAFVPVDTVFKEVTGVILVRYQDERTAELKGALPSLHEMVDMSKGKASFQKALTDIVSGLEQQHLTIAVDDSEEAALREARRERDRLDESERKKTKAYRATEDSAALERELHHLWMQMKNVESKYEVFGLWKGCGRKALQDRFYKMVIEHHPDAYGGNVSERVKNSAQDIFIYIKDSYQELLKAEKEQAVAPKGDVTINPLARRVTTSTRATPIKPASNQQPQPAPVVSAQVKVEVSEPVEQEEQELSREDVKARIERLSGFRKREQQRMRRRSRGLTVESDLMEYSFIEESEVEEAEPEVDVEAERREKMMALQRKASRVNHPNLSNPAKEAFNDGYRAFREESYAEALTYFEQAYNLIPEDGMYQTYYAYVLFKRHPERHEEVEEILKNAINSGHKQALPDAILFMGHLLKSRGELDKALKHYERALKLNPACTEAERELRLSKLRNERKSSEPGSFIKNLFKK